MAATPPHLCGGCGRITTGSCRSCAKRREVARGTSTARGYSQAWADFSRDWLRHFPWCGQRLDGRFHVEHSRCAAEGRREPATCTDHIVSMANGGAPMSRANAQSLCVACNARKSVLVDARQRRATPRGDPGGP